MVSSIWVGLLLGSAALYMDAWLTTGVFGFENPYLTLAICVLAVMAVVGSVRLSDRGRIIGTVIGIGVGIIATNSLRVAAFSAESLLAGIGL
jgi:hypothetical protein